MPRTNTHPSVTHIGNATSALAWPRKPAEQPLRQAVEILNNSMQSPSYSWASRGCSSTHLGIHRAPGSVPTRRNLQGSSFRGPLPRDRWANSAWAVQLGSPEGHREHTSQTTLAWKNGWEFFFSRSFLINNSGASLRIIFHHTSIQDTYAYSHPMQGPS